MCRYVHFDVELIDRRAETAERLEEMILAYEVEMDRAGRKHSRTQEGIWPNRVPFITGSLEEGFRTDLHCDCDNVIEDGRALLLYPELFAQIIDQQEVKHIDVQWDLAVPNGSGSREKLPMSRFLELNDAGRLEPRKVYRILKDSYR